mmetsp:Transcript_53111/g.121273  ORF Transcript_53111/g.121273 Transcript_53111/m.121273 type:complete len:234 (+) Transcript_53111:634-1335(+)
MASLQHYGPGQDWPWTRPGRRGPLQAAVLQLRPRNPQNHCRHLLALALTCPRQHQTPSRMLRTSPHPQFQEGSRHQRHRRGRSCRAEEPTRLPPRSPRSHCRTGEQRGELPQSASPVLSQTRRTSPPPRLPGERRRRHRSDQPSLAERQSRPHPRSRQSHCRNGAQQDGRGPRRRPARSRTPRTFPQSSPPRAHQRRTHRRGRRCLLAPRSRHHPRSRQSRCQTWEPVEGDPS